MWIDDIPADQDWTILWSDKFLCACGAIRTFSLPCPVCGAQSPSFMPQKVVLDNGKTVEILPTFAGAEGRYEDYVYLQMMEREWVRPKVVPTNEHSIFSEISDKSSVVLLFWSYFETRMERILRLGCRGIPERIVEDTFERYSSIGSRLDKLYRVLYGTTYRADLESLGRLDIWNHISNVKNKRNEFIHGNPIAINDELAYRVVEYIRDEHEAWIGVFNKRLSAMRR